MTRDEADAALKSGKYVLTPRDDAEMDAAYRQHRATRNAPRVKPQPAEEPPPQGRGAMYRLAAAAYDALVWHHDHEEDCTCDYDDGSMCWYRMDEAQRREARVEHMARVMEANDDA